MDILAIYEDKLLVNKQEIYMRTIIALITLPDDIYGIHSSMQCIDAIGQVGDINELTWDMVPVSVSPSHG